MVFMAATIIALLGLLGGHAATMWNHVNAAIGLSDSAS